MEKPVCDPGEYGDNVFRIIGRTIKALRKAGMHDRAEEFNNRARNAESYEQVWDIAEEYVEFV